MMVGENNWTVDTVNPEKKLTVKGTTAPEKVLKAVQDAGFKAAQL